MLYFKGDKITHWKKDPSPKTQISRTKICSITPLGIWHLQMRKFIPFAV